jgi:hypothetical protein
VVRAGVGRDAEVHRGGVELEETTSSPNGDRRSLVPTLAQRRKKTMALGS